MRKKEKHSHCDSNPLFLPHSSSPNWCCCPIPLTASIYWECVFDSPASRHLVCRSPLGQDWRWRTITDDLSAVRHPCTLNRSVLRLALSAANLINGRFYRIMYWKNTLHTGWFCCCHWCSLMMILYLGTARNTL